jgi:hypothetical protein
VGAQYDSSVVTKRSSIRGAIVGNRVHQCTGGLEMDDQSDMNKPVVGDSGVPDGGGERIGHGAAGAEMGEKTNGDDETLVARFEKSAMEEVRVTLGRYRGREVFGVRVWVGLTNGTMQPTRKGITLRLDSFPEFRGAIDRLASAIDAQAAAQPAEGSE